METNMPCITCKNDLADCGHPSADYLWAMCSICGAVYQICAAVDEFGHQLMKSDGTKVMYLNPVRAGNAAAFQDFKERYVKENGADSVPKAFRPKPDFQSVKSAIKKTKSVKEFLDQINKLG